MQAWASAMKDGIDRPKSSEKTAGNKGRSAQKRHRRQLRNGIHHGPVTPSTAAIQERLYASRTLYAVYATASFTVLGSHMGHCDSINVQMISEDCGASRFVAAPSLSLRS